MKKDCIPNWNDPNNYYAWENRFGLLIAFRQFHFSASFLQIELLPFPNFDSKMSILGAKINILPKVSSFLELNKCQDKIK